MRTDFQISNFLSISNEMAASSKAISRSLERLSTGKRFQGPQGDVASFTVSQGLQSQVRGLTQANLNINQNIGLVQTASAGLSSQTQILQRLREIAVQASNGSLSSNDRLALNEQVGALKEEFSRIAQTTEFNGKKLLNGSLGELSLLTGSSVGSSLDYVISSSSLSDSFQKLVGTGSYTQSSSFSLQSTTYRSHESIDVDLDGDLDIVTLAGGSGNLEVYLNDGAGNFGSAITSDVGGTGVIVAGDINGDGLTDIGFKSAEAASQIRFALGQGDGRFENTALLEASEVGMNSFNLADFDRDGNLDILFVGTSGVSVRLGDGAGNFGSEIFSSTSIGSPEESVVGDFNGDGLTDIALYEDGESELEIMLSNGDGTFTTSEYISNFGGESELLTAIDVNGDGIDDLVVSDGDESETRIFISNSDGSLNTDYEAGSYDYESISAGDYDRDGDIDIIGRRVGALYILRNNGSGVFEEVEVSGVTPSSVAGRIQWADFDGDGVLDINILDRLSDELHTYTGQATSESAADDIDVSSVERARDLIEIVDNAISSLSEMQTELGVLQNRLEINYEQNLLLSENLSEARSITEDADFALETAELVRNQILQQAQIAAFSQANSQAQVVFSLLNNLR